MYKFALNNIKLQRAIGICNGNPDAGCVRAVYEKLGGAVDPAYAEEVVVEPVVEVTEEEVVEPVVEVTEEEVTMPVVTKKTKKK